MAFLTIAASGCAFKTVKDNYDVQANLLTRCYKPLRPMGWIEVPCRGWGFKESNLK